MMFTHRAFSDLVQVLSAVIYNQSRFSKIKATGNEGQRWGRGTLPGDEAHFTVCVEYVYIRKE